MAAREVSPLTRYPGSATRAGASRVGLEQIGRHTGAIRRRCRPRCRDGGPHYVGRPPGCPSTLPTRSAPTSAALVKCDRHRHRLRRNRSPSNTFGASAAYTTTTVDAPGPTEPGGRHAHRAALPECYLHGLLAASVTVGGGGDPDAGVAATCRSSRSTRRTMREKKMDRPFARSWSAGSAKRSTKTITTKMPRRNCRPR